MFIGTDITEVNRIQYLEIQYKDKFLKKVFSKNEINYCKSKDNPFIHLCGTFSAKESVKKALLSSGEFKSISFLDIEIIRKPNGAPHAKLNKSFISISSINISISHTKEYATSIAMIRFR